ncbi:Star-Related Lipid Transfer Protein 6 [Manis pentadactyla]|nr:Star-Related Lipid Transfer Protein 6 [Manis pentadactyla]
MSRELAKTVPFYKCSLSPGSAERVGGGDCISLTHSSYSGNFVQRIDSSAFFCFAFFSLVCGLCIIYLREEEVQATGGVHCGFSIVTCFTCFCPLPPPRNPYLQGWCVQRSEWGGGEEARLYHSLGVWGWEPSNRFVVFAPCPVSEALWLYPAPALGHLYLLAL